MPPEICLGCNHSIGEHFQSVDGVVRCTHVESGVSTSGILGLPWTSKCDCENHVSKFVESEKIRKKREQDEWQRNFDEQYKIHKIDELMAEVIDNV